MSWRVALAAVLLIGLIGTAAIVRGIVPLEGKRTAPPFALIEAKTGAPFTEASLQGKPTAMFFGFTACPDVCPTALNTAGRWLKALGDDAEKLRFVFVSVDPERDTVERMAQYVGAFDPRIIGVTGEREQLERVYRAFHVVANKVPSGDSYMYEHTALILLLDRTGELIGTVDFEDPEADAVAELRELIRR